MHTRPRDASIFVAFEATRTWSLSLPIQFVVGASIERHDGLLGRDIPEAIPTGPHESGWIADARAGRPIVVSRLQRAGTCTRMNSAGAGCYDRYTAHVQQPPPCLVFRMLDAAGMKFLAWNEWPAFPVPLDVQELVHLGRRL